MGISANLNNKEVPWKILGWLLDFIATAGILLMGYFWRLNVDEHKRFMTDLNGLNNRVTALELWQAETRGNRFTSADGQAVWKEIAAIRQEMLQELSSIRTLLASIEYIKEDVKEVKRVVEQMRTDQKPVQK
jgi:hypothetical protein